MKYYGFNCLGNKPVTFGNFILGTVSIERVDKAPHQRSKFLNTSRVLINITAWAAWHLVVNMQPFRVFVCSFMYPFSFKLIVLKVSPTW